MLENIVTNIESNTSKLETTETNRVGGGDNSGTNTIATKMDAVITGVDGYPDHVTAEVAEDDQHSIRNTGVSTYA